MRIRLVTLDLPSKDYVTFYTLYHGSDTLTLFEKFNKKYTVKSKKNINVIKMQLKTMGMITGAVGNYFESAEITPGDKVFSLRLYPKNKLRLYCIRYSEKLVIIGGGGFVITGKGSERADRILMKENKLMSEISNFIYEKLNSNEISISHNGMSFLGKLELDNSI